MAFFQGRPHSCDLAERARGQEGRGRGAAGAGAPFQGLQISSQPERRAPAGCQRDAEMCPGVLYSV